MSCLSPILDKIKRKIKLFLDLVQFCLYFKKILQSFLHIFLLLLFLNKTQNLYSDTHNNVE